MEVGTRLGTAVVCVSSVIDNISSAHKLVDMMLHYRYTHYS